MMTRRIVRWVGGLVCACTQFLFSTACAAPLSGKPAKLEHMDYYSARKIILSYGWKPAPGPCEQVDDDTCKLFPEIEICQDVWPGYCGMVFVRKDRCLDVETSGGQPEDRIGDTTVDAVIFHSGPCQKSSTR